jgi:hypothetical protein
MRSAQTYDLRQRPALTSVLLVHTEEVTGSIPVSPTQVSRPVPIVAAAVQAALQAGKPSRPPRRGPRVPAADCEPLF